jgi:hypothetical protein
MLSRRTKSKLARKAAKELAAHPTLRHATVAAAKPVAKRKLRRSRRRALAAARGAGTTLAEYAPPAAEALGLVEPRKQPKTAWRLILGIVIGAGAMYLLEPDKGAARRQALLALLRS